MNNYAIRHPRLDVIAIVTAKSALTAMRLLMDRDATWGDIGLHEAVWLRKSSGAECYSLYGSDDCNNIAGIKDVITEIDRRRALPIRPLWRRTIHQILCPLSRARKK